MAKIIVVGIGPGNFDDMTPRARKAIENASVVAGYKTYINLIEPLLEGKEVIGTGMTQEIDRCKAAVEAAAAGKDTVVVSSGDSGVYGMAGLVLELVLQLPEAERPEWGGVVAGVSAVNAAASLLGAPLMHDFAVISLSDWMTPWELIKRELLWLEREILLLPCTIPRASIALIISMRFRRFCWSIEQPLCL